MIGSPTWLLVLAIVALLGPMAYRRRARLSRILFVLVRRTTLEFISIALLAIVVIMWAYAYAAHPGTGKPTLEAFMPVLFAATLAAIGWLYSTFHGIRNSIAAYTATVLDQHRTNAAFEDHRRRVVRVFPEGLLVSKEAVAQLLAEQERYPSEVKRAQANNTDLPEPPTVYSIVQILNFFEQVAVGIRNDRLDETAIENYLAPIMYRSVAKFLYLIQHHRSSNKRFYSDLHWLMHHWYGIDFDTIDQEKFVTTIESVRNRIAGW